MGNFNRDRRDGRGDFRRDGSFGRDRSFRGRGGFGRGDRGERRMFKAICANCGKDCEVPFRPTGDKPVYCSDCFEKMGKRDGRGDFDRPRRENRGFSEDKYKAQLDLINTKLDQVLNFLNPKKAQESPAPSVPVLEDVTKESQVKPAKTKKASMKKSTKKSSE